MSGLDQSREMEKLQIDILRKMSPEKKWGQMMELIEISRGLLMEGIRNCHPEYGEEELKLALIKILIGEELFSLVYPDAKGIGL